MLAIIMGRASTAIVSLGPNKKRGKRQTPDGSTFDVHFLGQFLNATDSVGTYTTDNGTGRFAGETGKGRWAARRWANGKGSESKIEGEATKSR